MSAFSLKWLALLTMVIDHVGLAFFPQYPLLRAVGRLSFPIFAFLLAEGFAHTSNRKQYALRLAAFAVLSELPYELFVYGQVGGMFPMKNILFALLLAFGALHCVERGGFWLPGAAALMLIAHFGAFSYGAYGVLLVVCFFLVRKQKLWMVLLLAACTVLHCILWQSWFQIWAVLAAVPLLFYNGERGKRMSRYLFYAFYPAHITAIVLVRYGLRLLAHRP